MTIQAKTFENGARSSEHTVVELNRVVVRRNEWSTRDLSDEDRIEIVHFVGGGRG